MAKWYGKVGYIETTETSPGVWTEQYTEREYYGDLTRNHKRFENAQYLNDNITLQNEISIVCDPYALQNFQYIRYVEVMGSFWRVTAVDVQYPRLVLSVGDVYSGITSSTPTGSTGTTGSTSL